MVVKFLKIVNLLDRPKRLNSKIRANSSRNNFESFFRLKCSLVWWKTVEMKSFWKKIDFDQKNLSQKLHVKKKVISTSDEGMFLDTQKIALNETNRMEKKKWSRIFLEVGQKCEKLIDNLRNDKKWLKCNLKMVPTASIFIRFPSTLRHYLRIT